MKTPKVLVCIGMIFIGFELSGSNLSNFNSFRDTVAFRVMTYNGLKLSDDDTNRFNYFETVFDSANPDIILMQEIIDEAVCDTILDRLNSGRQEFERAAYTNGYDMDNMLFYRTSKFTFLSQDTIQTDLRDWAEYVLIVNNNQIRFYSGHLKASQGSTNEQRRLLEATVLRNWLNDSIPVDAEFIVVGDMNFYSDEPAYYKLIDSEANNNGRSKDPLELPGNWHDNIIYAGIHTQSTRDTAFGGGASGGMDDRFDFIFIRHDLNNGSGVEYVDGSYRSYGQDGNHFNQSVNEGGNDSVSVHVADALFYASDHLSVYADFFSFGGIGISEKEDLIIHSRVEISPNPFYNNLKVEGYAGLIKVYDANGRFIAKFKKCWNGEDSVGIEVKPGVYFLIPETKYQKVTKVIRLK
jgi:endonuclease/exonuclease/phosphatase family metal-dependent hydrolase